MPELIDPNGNVTLEEILKQVSTYRAGVQSTLPKVQEAIREQKSLTDDTARILADVGEDSKLVSLTRSAGVLETQARVAKVAAISGTDINASNERYSNLIAIKNKAQDEKDQALAAIKEKTSVGIFDNPIQYIINGFTINKDVAAHNIANNQLASAEHGINSLNVDTQATIQTQKMLEVGTTVASAEAAARVAASAAMIQANAAKTEGFQYNITALNAATNASKEDLSAVYQAFGAVKTEQGMKVQLAQLGIAQAHLKVAIEGNAMNRELKQLTIDDRNAKMRADENTITFINKGREARNLPPLEGESLGMLKNSLTTGKGVIGASLQNDLNKGMLMMMDGKGDKPIIATSSADFLTMQANKISVNLTPAQQPVANLISSIVQDLSSNALASKDPGMTKARLDLQTAKANKDTNLRDNTINAMVQSGFDKAAGNIIPEDKNNPYNISSVNSIAAASKTVANLPVYQKVFAEQVKAGVQITDPNKVFADVSKALAEKKITFAEALETTAIFQVGVLKNTADRNMQGIAGIVPRLSYNTTINVPGATFMPSKIIDMTRPDQLARMLMQAQAVQANPSLYQSNRILD